MFLHENLAALGILLGTRHGLRSAVHGSLLSTHLLLSRACCDKFCIEASAVLFGSRQGGLSFTLLELRSLVALHHAIELAQGGFSRGMGVLRFL